MKYLFIFLSFFCCHLTGNGQSFDMLVLKKSKKTVNKFFPGDNMTFSTETAYYDGVITSIDRDTIFLVQYDIRQIPSNLGIYFLDTVATYHYAIYYKDILALDKKHNKQFNWSASGGALFGGGILLTTVGLGTWLFSKPNTRYYASPYLVGSAALLGGIGYFLLKVGAQGTPLGKKYSLEYIEVK